MFVKETPAQNKISWGKKKSLKFRNSIESFKLEVSWSFGMPHPHASPQATIFVIVDIGWHTKKYCWVIQRGFRRRATWKICEPLVPPVVVTDLIIKLLFELRVLLKVLVSCHLADLLLCV